MKVADLSHYQNVTSYPLFKNSFDAFYIKVTEGNYYEDPAWIKHHINLQGKPLAPYHFMGDRVNFGGQVSKFLSRIRTRSWDWGPVLDVEFNSNKQAGDPTSVDIRNWVAEYRRQSASRLIYVYIGRSTWLSTAPPSEWADADTRIIGARYKVNDFNAAFDNFGLTHPYLDAVQYWNQGTAPGLSGTVDLNNFKRIITAQANPPVSSKLIIAGANDA